MAGALTAHCQTCTCEQQGGGAECLEARQNGGGEPGLRLRPGKGPVELQEIDGGAVRNGESVAVDIRPAAADDDEPSFAERVAKNLLELNSGRHPKLKVAFDDWEATFELFRKRREYKEAQRDAIRNEIYQLIGFFIVFQGVVYTAVAQANVLHCKNWWTSFTLSALASIVTIGGVLQKLNAYWALEKTIATEKASSKVLRQRCNNVKIGGPQHFDFKKHAPDGKSSDLKRPGASVVSYMLAVITVLLIFSAVFLVSCYQILCKPGLAPS